MMKEKKAPLIVFVRHAHREKFNPDRDNGLSAKGLAQVEALVADYKEGRLPESRYFWSSPKKRCLETLMPLSAQAMAPLVKEDLLDERQPTEGNSQFNKRIYSFLKKVESLEETVYLCSHGDLIPEALGILTGNYFDLPKGQAVSLKFARGKWEIL